MDGLVTHQSNQRFACEKKTGERFNWFCWVHRSLSILDYDELTLYLLSSSNRRSVSKSDKVPGFNLCTSEASPFPVWSTDNDNWTNQFHFFMQYCFPPILFTITFQKIFNKCKTRKQKKGVCTRFIMFIVQISRIV